MKRIIKWLDMHFEEKILAFFLAMVALIILLQVVMRYIFKAALPWPEELSRYCFVCSTMLSMGYCIKKGAMLRVDILVKLLPRAGQEIIEAFIKLISLALYLYLFLYSFNVVSIAYNSKQLSTAMQLPMYIVYVFAPIGFGLAVVRTVQDIVMTVIRWTRSHGQKKGEMAK